ncbi:hypothetical protein K2D_25290 [Planctomycetes bacterium K2D]|uniref:Uncharacterized protein n=1 Tax=Botrimarina mediterranea TaxID=2528022 RepID=A0A518K963_9BACT|nr:hypothetical protein Spa11_25280 [Botrimarina mediterranea]QDV78920.1 hypothetical protein K2D_25290 [Planctomycetes bacterium K2D]
MRQPHHSKLSQRPGFVMIAVLVLLMVTAALATGWTTSVLQGRRLARLQHQQRQAERLAEAAVARAVARLNTEPNYTGEVWQVSAVQLGQEYGAEVQITIDATDGDDAQRIIAQVALSPIADSPVRHTISHRF